jgi:prepilin-type N-terminal cleavage/methylation domain-containing protein
MMRNKKAFTLLEVMIAILLLAITASVLAVRVSKAIDDQRFKSGGERLKNEILVSRQLALNMQADWQAQLELNGDELYFRRSSLEADQTIAMHWKCPGEMLWNHQRVQKISFLFSSTGKVIDVGVIELIGPHQCMMIDISQLFSIADRADDQMPRPDSLKI